MRTGDTTFSGIFAAAVVTVLRAFGAECAVAFCGTYLFNTFLIAIFYAFVIGKG